MSKGGPRPNLGDPGQLDTFEVIHVDPEEQIQYLKDRISVLESCLDHARIELRAKQDLIHNLRKSNKRFKSDYQKLCDRQSAKKKGRGAAPKVADDKNTQRHLRRGPYSKKPKPG